MFEIEDKQAIKDTIVALNAEGREAYEYFLEKLKSAENEEAVEWIIRLGKDLIEEE